MELELIRSYFPCGTNGELYLNGERICFTIELPWLGNKPRLSCIPEGRYEIEKRFSEHHGWHMHVKDVPRRDLAWQHRIVPALLQVLFNLIIMLISK